MIFVIPLQHESCNCIDFLKRYVKCQHAIAIAIQIYTNLDGRTQPHHGVMDTSSQKVSERCTDQYVFSFPAHSDAVKICIVVAHLTPPLPGDYMQ